ncbi:N-acetylmuramoyl-L-alanine amidase [Terrabacter terrae]
MLTEDAMLAALAKWDIVPKFYRPDWRDHDRDTAQGWGPIYGFICHNFGSDNRDPDAINYLYTGDNARGMPGPLSQLAIDDDGEVWVVGWGTANHTGSIGAGLLDMVKRDAAPLDRDVVPNTTFSNRTGVLAINKNFIGVEMTYGKAPTQKQHASLIRLAAAVVDALGPGYSGGSVVGHRECDSQRSDPVGIPMHQLRNEINLALKAGPAATTLEGLSMSDVATLLAAINKVDANVTGLRSEEAGRYKVDTNRHSWVATVLTQLSGKVGVDVDEQAIAAQVLTGLTPQVSDAVKAAVAATPGAGIDADTLAAAVVAQLGAKLT